MGSRLPKRLLFQPQDHSYPSATAIALGPQRSDCTFVRTADRTKGLFFMGYRTRRLLAVPMMALTAGAGLVVASSPAQAAGATATVKVSSTLMTRSGPSLASRVTGSLHNGQRVSAVCRVTGQSIRGSIRTTAQWD